MGLTAHYAKKSYELHRQHAKQASAKAKPRAARNLPLWPRSSATSSSCSGASRRTQRRTVVAGIAAARDLHYKTGSKGPATGLQFS
jgi:hypothetical protein